MDKFMQSQKTVPLRKKAKVSVADLMRAGAAKKKPFGENDATAMGSLGAKALARIDARIRKEQSALSDDQRSVVDKAKDGGNVFITGNAARPPASVPCRHRPRAPRSADTSPRCHVDLPRRRVSRRRRGCHVDIQWDTSRGAAARGYVRGVAAYHVDIPRRRESRRRRGCHVDIP